MVKRTGTNNDIQNSRQKTKDWAIGTPEKSGVSADSPEGDQCLLD